MKKRKANIAEMNVVPYIDVMLVLLVIFMITAPLVTQGVDVTLPKAETKVIESKDEPPLIASIDVAGKLYLTAGTSMKDPLQPSDFMALAMAHLKLNPKAKVFVRADAAVKYDAVMQAMALLKQAGFEKVGLMTDFPPTSSNKVAKR